MKTTATQSVSHPVGIRALRRTLAASVIGAAAIPFVLHGQSPPPAVPRPTFHAGTDLVELDVSVLDKKREPVRGLTAADFSIVQDGVTQPIAAFLPIDIPGPAASTASWMAAMTARGNDVASNAVQDERLVVLVLDDSLIAPGAVDTVKQISKRFIDELGPLDLAAVVFPAFGQNQNFTTDRAALRAALDSFRPHPNSVKCLPPQPPCRDPVLDNIGTLFSSAPAGRKIVIYVGPPPPTPHVVVRRNGTSFTFTNDMARAFARFQQENVVFYSINPRGLITGARMADVAGMGRPEPPPLTVGITDPLADATGGFTVDNTNTPWTGVDDLFRENASYYLIGFTPVPADSATDGQSHGIHVTVDRAGVEVHTRTSYVGPRTPASATPAAPAAEPIDDALARGLPTGGIPVRLALAPFAMPGRSNTHDATLVVITDLSDLAPTTSSSSEPPSSSEGSTSAPNALEVVATAFDLDWHARATERHTLDLTGRDGRVTSVANVLSLLRVPPGRYEVRVAGTRGGASGSVFSDLDVPDFTKAAISLSGLVLSRTPAGPVAGAAALADLLPVVPTAARTFAPTDHVAAFVRVYQGGDGRLAPTSVAARVIDDHDRPVFDDGATFAPGQFDPERAADYRVELPIARLTPGAYLLTVTATLGKHTVTRDVRLQVAPPAPPRPDATSR